jgi:hypothetical protein
MKKQTESLAHKAIRIILTVRGYKVVEYKGYLLEYLPTRDPFRKASGAQAWVISENIKGEPRIIAEAPTGHKAKRLVDGWIEQGYAPGEGADVIAENRATVASRPQLNIG